MNEQRLSELLAATSPPGAEAAQVRGRLVVEGAFAQRRPARGFARGWAPALAAAAAAIAIAIVAITPPGAAVADWIKDQLGIDAKNTHPAPALGALPGGGRVLVTSRSGLWIVHADGSRRRLGAYRDAGWSPQGLFVVAVRGHQLVALEPEGAARWALSRPAAPHSPAWAPDGLHVAYLSGGKLRVVEGDGAPDALVGRAADVAPAWRAGAQPLLAYSDPRGRVVVFDVAAGRRMWSTPAVRDAPQQLAWSADGHVLAVRSARRIRFYDVDGRPRGSVALPHGAEAVGLAPAPRLARFALALLGSRRSTVAVVTRSSLTRVFSASGTFAAPQWSPNGGKLLVGWPDADEWLFIPARHGGRITAVGSLTRQFDPGAKRRGDFPQLRGWCCPTLR